MLKICHYVFTPTSKITLRESSAFSDCCEKIMLQAVGKEVPICKEVSKVFGTSSISFASGEPQGTKPNYEDLLEFVRSGGGL